MRSSVPKGKLSLRLDLQVVESLADQTVFLLLLVSTLGVVLPFRLGSLASPLAYPATLLLFLYRWKQILYVLTRDITYLTIVAFAVISITWSAAPSHSFAIIRSLINTTILIAYISASYSPRGQMQLWARVFLTWGIASLGVELLFPGYTKLATGVGGQDYWQGIFSFKLGLGLAMALGIGLAVYSLALTRIKKWMPIGCILLALIMIILSKSKTSLSACAIVLSLFPLYLASMHKSFKLRAAAYLLVIGVALSIIVFATVNFETILVDWLGKDLTLTGRSSLWEAVLIQGVKRPWLGYGHGAFWFTENSLDAIALNDWPTLPRTGEYLESFHSHSGYIELFLNLGLVGVGLFALNYAVVLSRVLFLFFTLKRPEFLWMIQIIAVVTVINFSEVGSFLIGRNLLWMLYSTTALSSALVQTSYQWRAGRDRPQLNPTAFSGERLDQNVDAFQN